jgi:hypothetical protein
MSNDNYVVRVTSLANAAAGLFTWELCRGDDLLVIQRSPRTFPTRVEALFDSAQNAAILEFGAIPSPFARRPLIADVLDLHGPL